MREYFGFEDFREGQADVIGAVLQGDDCLVIMPTGSGKSLCYQLPALMLEGTTLVISPLIALMKDQTDALWQRDIPATFINSSLTYDEQMERLRAMRRGAYKLVYVAPERFRNERFVEALKEIQISLFAVDEAHCISHWGHDFRPDYLRLQRAVESISNPCRPQVIALTATATPYVRADIAEQLGLDRARHFVAGFDRQNLILRVIHTKTEIEKINYLVQTANSIEGSGIIFAATRKAVESVATKLINRGISAAAYHAGMDERQRTRVQDEFMSGQIKTIVATNAFGMGVDKRDIRFVIHYHLTDSIESYYQEIGRAGRDGLPALCTLLFNYADRRTQDYFIEGSYPPPEIIEEVYKALIKIGAERIEMTSHELVELTGIKNEMAVQSALVILEKAGHIERGQASENLATVTLRISPLECLERARRGAQHWEVLRALLDNYDLVKDVPQLVSPDRLAESLGMTRPQVLRGLSQLSELELINYRPSFRGRGIQMLDKEPAKSLRINRQELARRAANEQWKLRRMVDYAYTNNCLRAFILDYFNDIKRLSRCGACSNCAGYRHQPAKPASAGAADGTLTIKRINIGPSRLDEFIIDSAPTGESLRRELSRNSRRKQIMETTNELFQEQGPRARQLSDEEILIVRKILSCVARLKGRFGKGVLINVLRGSRARQVLSNKLDKLSTYGLLKELPQDELKSYVENLISAGCIEVSKEVYPTLSLTEFGRNVMLERARVEFLEEESPLK